MGNCVGHERNDPPHLTLTAIPDSLDSASGDLMRMQPLLRDERHETTAFALPGALPHSPGMLLPYHSAQPPQDSTLLVQPKHGSSLLVP